MKARKIVGVSYLPTHPNQEGKMDDKLIVLYYVCDELLKVHGPKEDNQVKMSHAEVLLVAIVAAYFFGGSYRRARLFLQFYRYVPNMLSESRLNRRLHAFDSDLLHTIFHLIGAIFARRNSSNEYIVDSFPLSVCHNIRIFRCHIFKEEHYRGYCASKKSFFYGIKVHLVTTAEGEPFSFSFSPGSVNDCRALREMSLTLPKGAILYADRAYQDRELEKQLLADDITFLPQRRGNQKHQWPSSIAYIQQRKRKRIETTISSIKRLMSYRIEAVTAKGFALKVYFFLLAAAIARL